MTEWLEEVGLEEYAESFVDNGYETAELCAQLTGVDMNAIGVTNKHHRSVLHAHARKLLEHSVCLTSTGPDTDEPDANGPGTASVPAEARLGAGKSKPGALSGSLECLMQAVIPGGELRSKTYEKPSVLVKSSSLQSLNTLELGSESETTTASHTLELDSEPTTATRTLELDSEPTTATHKRTLSDHTPSVVPVETGTHKRVSSDTSSADQGQSLSGLPPQLPLHSQFPHDYSPNKETKTKTGASPLKDTPSKIRAWLHDHHHKGSFLVRKKHRDITHTASSPLLPLRPRRSSGTVSKLRATQMNAHSTDPLELLSSYQFLSLSYCSGAESSEELRTVITKAPHNTEAQNYKISFQVEK